MDFSWTDEQLQLRNAAVDFARAELGREVTTHDAEGVFSRDDWRKCAAFGIQGFGVPEAYGGRGHDLLTTFLIMEGLGYGCRDNGLTFALNAQYVSVVATLVAAGTADQNNRYLRGIVSGDLIGSYAMTEPGTGSDAFGLQTGFKATADGFVLNGHKCFVTFGPVADFHLVFATENPELGQWGISLFLVPSDTPGLTVTNPVPKMGLRTVPMGELRLDDCEVAGTALVGEEGAGAAIFNEGQDFERAAILASQVGAMEHQLERAVAFARSREQFGQPIGQFQAVSHRIADMKVRLEVARLMAYKAVWAIQAGEPASTVAAIANVCMAEGFVQSSLDAILVHGGRGYLTETGVERDLRDAVGGPVYGGTSDIQRNIIARHLGL